MLGVLLGVVIVWVGAETPFAVDIWWNQLVTQQREGFVLWFAYAMDWLGGGWFGVFGAPILITVCLVVARRPWGAAYFLAATIVSAGLVQVLKHLFGRARPEKRCFRAHRL